MIDGIIEAINAFAEWLWGLVKDLVDAVVELLRDLVVWALDGVLGALAAIIAAIPVPSFVQVGLGDILSGVHPMIGYFASGLNIGAGLSLLAAGFAFRMLRKVLTLFQW